jgi:3-methylcrotonyl-CoA carboxylase alpha subunit
MWGRATATAALGHGDGPVETVRLTEAGGAWEAETPAGAAVARALPDGRVSVAPHDRRLAVNATPGMATVMRDGLALRFAVPDPLAAIDAAGPSDDVARAPMTGAVIAVHVEPGAVVKAGDRLVTMEAMKMEHALRAPRDGAVESVHVAPGDQVEEGAPLAALRPA